jgi:hypothetical protein
MPVTLDRFKEAPMQSTLNPKLPDDPHDVLVVAPDVVLVAPTDEELSKLAHIMRHPSGPQARTEPDFSEGPAVPPVDTTFRAVPGDRPSFGARAMRAFVGFLLAVCIGIGAAAWQAYGDTAQELIAKWMPQLTSSPSPENPGLAGQPDPAAVQSSAQSSAQASAATPAPAQPAPPAPTAAEGVAPTAAAPSAAEAPSLQSMARDLAAVGQQVEQLKASIEQLKASQEQMSRDVAKVSEAKVSEAKASEIKASEPNLRPRVSAVSAPRPAAVPVRKPPPALRPAQTAAAPILPPAAAPYPPRQPDYAARQVEPLPPPPAQPPLDRELTSVPRPPLPLSQ